MKAWSGVTLSALACVAATALAAPGWTQSAPAYTDAGRVMQAEQMNWFWRQSTPWAMDPFWQKKNPAMTEPLIEFHNMDLKGQIVTPAPAGQGPEGGQ